YALAAMRLVAGDGFWGIGLCQAMLGVANVALVYLLAARLFGGAVPVIAALGAALYGPFLLHETLVLRDTLGVTVSLLLLWWLAGCDDARALPWLVAGGFFALALLAREATLVFVPFVALWIARRFGRHPRALATVALAFAVGLWLDRRPAARHRLLRYCLLASVGALMYSTVVARYRLPAVAILLVYAGVSGDWTAREVAAGRWKRAALAALAVVGVAAASAGLLCSVERRQRYRADEFLLAGEVY